LSLAAGEVYWALVPYTPQVPFQVYVEGNAPVEVPAVDQVVDGLRRGGDAEFAFVVGAKARPVLLLSERSDPSTGELFGLRLLRLSALGAQEREAVREQREPHLFHLRPERMPKLSEESAALVSAPIRLHESTIDTRRLLGRLDKNEMRVLSERFVSYWGFDLHQMLLAKIRELRARRSE
jgi:hypothetical protein